MQPGGACAVVAGTPPRLPAACSSKLHALLVGATSVCSAVGHISGLARPGRDWGTCFAALVQDHALHPTHLLELSVPGQMARHWPSLQSNQMQLSFY